MTSGFDFSKREYLTIAEPVTAHVEMSSPRADSTVAMSDTNVSELSEDLPIEESDNTSVATAEPGDRRVPETPVKADAQAATSSAKPSVMDEVFNGLLSSHKGYNKGPDLGQEWLQEIAKRTRNALLTRNMAAKLLEMVATPNAALLRFEGSGRLTVSMIESKMVEIKTTDGIDIIAVRPELGAIALSVARPQRRILSLHEVWRSWNPDISRGNAELMIAVKESDGSAVFLSSFPNAHSLVAGFTGSGKSVLMQNIILGIAATNTPEQAQLLLIDPKGALDYAAIEGLPHLRQEIITDPESSIQALTALVQEMERRQPLFREHRAPNIDQYIEKTGLAIPKIWVVHDEFGDWMQDEHYADGVTGLVNRLAQKARALGIYMLFASQRPDATIFPMILRSNLGNRLILKVDSPGTSDLALGIKNGGAERLLGQGHMLALTGGVPEPIYCQVPFVSTDDLELLVKEIGKRYKSSDRAAS